MVPHGLISQKLKKLQQAESLPLCPIDAAFFLQQCSLATRAFKINLHYWLKFMNKVSELVLKIYTLVVVLLHYRTTSYCTYLHQDHQEK